MSVCHLPKHTVVSLSWPLFESLNIMRLRRLEQAPSCYLCIVQSRPVSRLIKPSFWSCSFLSLNRSQHYNIVQCLILIYIYFFNLTLFATKNIVLSFCQTSILQAMFEVITSEASYLRSLNILTSHFINSDELSAGSSLCVLERGQSHVLFSNISAIKSVSER